MRLLKNLGVRTVTLAVALAMAPAAVPSSVPLVGVSLAQAGDHFGRHYRGHRYYRLGPRFHSGRYYRHHRHHNSGAAAIAGAIIGLGIGAAIASSPRYYEPAPRYYRVVPRYYRVGPVFRSPAWYDYCAARYRSFDPYTGTFQPYHGPRRICR